QTLIKMSVKCLISRNILNKNSPTLLWNLTRHYSQDPQNTSEDPNVVSTTPTKPKSGYAKAFEKFQSLDTKDKGESSYTFKQLLMKSKFIDLGDPQGKVVTGKIYHVVEDDLYIDFGWKFHCICPRPKTNARYIRCNLFE
ncbi:hypothetical protein AMK59_6150, partial [Oryctes borbonicus]